MKKDNLPLVTIGVASYNNSKYILETLDSIVNQTYPNIEIIIIDDCSTDDSLILINRWKKSLERSIHIKVIANSINQGVTKVCGIMLENAKGKYFSFFSSDDVMLQNKTNDLVAVLEEEKSDVAGVFSIAQMINEKGELIPKSTQGLKVNDATKESLYEQMTEFFVIHTLTVMLVTEKLREVGGFNEEYCYEDHDLFLRILNRYRMVNVPIETVKYRVHETQSKKVLREKINIDKFRLLIHHYKKSNRYKGAFKRGSLRPLKHLSFYSNLKIKIIKLFFIHFALFFDPRAIYYLLIYFRNSILTSFRAK